MGTVSNEGTTTTSIEPFHQADLRRAEADARPTEVWTGGGDR